MSSLFNPDLVLVDGSSYLYRAYHALPPLTNSLGQPTGVVYGVIGMIRKLQKRFPSKYFAVVFDSKEKTFRHTLYPNYKANRQVMPEDLQQQVPAVHETIEALGIPLLVQGGVEADDLIGTLAISAKKLQLKTMISTGDKDFAQLVDSDICLYNAMSDSFLDEEGVVTKFGLPAGLIVDLLALMGDTVDNIPGVPNVGPKTAVKWLQQYGTLENLMAHMDDITGKVGQNLRDAATILPLYKELTKIDTQVPLHIPFDDLLPKPVQSQALHELLTRLEFKTLLKEIEGIVPQERVPHHRENERFLVTSEETFQRLLKELEIEPLFSFFCLTSEKEGSEGFSFSFLTGKSFYIPFSVFSKEAMGKGLAPFFQDKKTFKVTHFLKQQSLELKKAGFDIKIPYSDTMVESYVLNSVREQHDLDFLSEQVLHRKARVVEKTSENSMEETAAIAMERSECILDLHQKFLTFFENNSKLKEVLETIELPLVPILFEMEQHGIQINPSFLEIFGKELEQKIKTLEEEAYVLAGHVFNLNSPKQLQEILYQEMGLPILQKTPKQQPSTSEEVLQELALLYPLPKIILEHRHFSKLNSTYVDPLPRQCDPETHRVHTTYHQTITATGRLSSSNPNLQNIPIRTEEGRKIRQAFVSPPGYVLMAADYSQIELRIMAHLSKDEGLLKAFLLGEDVHQATAAEVFGVSLEAVTQEMRRRAKAINFGLIYGMSSFGLAKQLGVDRNEAKNYIDIYFARYPGVLRYMETTRKLAHSQQYVETLFGRKLYLPNIESKNMNLQKAAERAAINAPLQGTAADIIKLAMIEVSKKIKAPDAFMILQVHDELVFEVKEESVEVVSRIIEEGMTQVVVLEVPLVVDIKSGNNWNDAHF